MNGYCQLSIIPLIPLLFRFSLNPTSCLLWFGLLTLTHLLEVSSGLPWALQCHPIWVVV